MITAAAPIDSAGFMGMADFEEVVVEAGKETDGTDAAISCEESDDEDDQKNVPNLFQARTPQ